MRRFLVSIRAGKDFRRSVNYVIGCQIHIRQAVTLIRNCDSVEVIDLDLGYQVQFAIASLSDGYLPTFFLNTSVSAGTI